MVSIRKFLVGTLFKAPLETLEEAMLKQEKQFKVSNERRRRQLKIVEKKNEKVHLVLK